MNSVTTPFISIIVAVFNGVKTLQQCIDSVAMQTYQNKELIIIDGGSTDGTVELLTANRGKIAYWVSEPDRGIYHAFNKGISHAQGDWICFLGSDDYFWDERVLERMAPLLERLPEDIRIAYGQIMLVDAEGASLFIQGEPWENIKDQFKDVMCIPHQGAMHRSSLFKLRGLFDETFRIAGDYELYLRELGTGSAAFLPGIIVAAQRRGGVSSSSYLATLKDYWRAQRMHGRWMPGRHMLRILIREFLLWLLWKVLGDKYARKLLDLRRRIRGLPPHWTRT